MFVPFPREDSPLERYRTKQRAEFIKSIVADAREQKRREMNLMLDACVQRRVAEVARCQHLDQVQEKRAAEALTLKYQAEKTPA
jgi:hypothetical protein